MTEIFCKLQLCGLDTSTLVLQLICGWFARPTIVLVHDAAFIRIQQSDSAAKRGATTREERERGINSREATLSSQHLAGNASDLPVLVRTPIQAAVLPHIQVAVLEPAERRRASVGDALTLACASFIHWIETNLLSAHFSKQFVTILR